jgi:hypothetical protein
MDQLGTVTTMVSDVFIGCTAGRILSREVEPRLLAILHTTLPPSACCCKLQGDPGSKRANLTDFFIYKNWDHVEIDCRISFAFRRLGVRTIHCGMCSFLIIDARCCNNGLSMSNIPFLYPSTVPTIGIGSIERGRNVKIHSFLGTTRETGWIFGR